MNALQAQHIQMHILTPNSEAVNVPRRHYGAEDSLDMLAVVTVCHLWGYWGWMGAHFTIFYSKDSKGKTHPILGSDWLIID